MTTIFVQIAAELLTTFLLERYCIMKCIKYVITALLALFCFIMSSELYQLHLQMFSNQYFYIDIENEDRSQVCSIVASAAKKYNEYVFAIERQNVDTFHSRITIYADADTRNILSREQDVVEGESSSFFSGSTEVVLLSFSDVVNDGSVVRYYFTGSKDTVSSIRQTIYSQIATSYIHKDSVSVADKLIYGIWIILFGLVLLLTWVDMQFSKKSDFLKISMGSSVGKMIFGKILVDIVFNVAIFGAVYAILQSRLFLSYKLNFALYTLLIFFVLNSLLYLTLLKVDYKEVIYGANINGRLLANAYLLQAIVVILMVVSLSSNLVAIRENEKELAPYNSIEQLDGYTSLSITPSEGGAQSSESVVELEASIYLEAYLQDKGLLSTFCAALDDKPIVVLNEAALNTVVSNAGVFQEDLKSDFVVYIPENRYSEIDSYDIEFAAATTASTFFGLESYSFEAREYSHVDVVYFDLRNESELTFGSDLISDPIVVYCNLSKAQINELLMNNTAIDFGDRWTNIIFDINDTSFFSKSIKDRLADVQFRSVIELCNQYKSNLVRGVLLNSVLSAFLLVLNVMLISVIVKIEYLVHSKEIALKKILGYSVLQRNIAILSINVFSVFIAFVTGVILSKMYGIFDIGALCIVSVAILLINSTLILITMTVAEKHNTAHILKGGSL